MNKRAVLERLDYLKGQQKHLQANLWAIDGAIQDCEFWLTQFNEANDNGKNDETQKDANAEDARRQEDEV